MQIQINTDKHIQHDASVTRHVEDTLAATLGRFDGRVTRVEVHLSDENGERGGGHDRVCTLEARPAGHPPLVVSNKADSVAAAVNGAAKKMQSALGTALARQVRPDAA